ncbi:MAG: hypothetical protein IJS67_05585 [Clostridia bacterium]|nr:hypothetical protein [Clostridia bacterium]
MANSSKAYTYLGFAIKSGNVRFGLNTIETLRRADLLIVCQTAAKNTRAAAEKYARKFGCPILTTKDEPLENFVNRENCKIVAVTDKNLAEAILKDAGNDFTVFIGRH